MPATPSRRPVDTRLPAVSRTVARAAGRLAVAVLVVFHAWLLWTHITTGKIVEPDVQVRWLLAGLVAVALTALRRSCLPLFRGRRALVLWLLIVLIHGHAVWTGDAAIVAHLRVPQGVVDLVPVALDVAALTVLACVAWLRRGLPAARLRPALARTPVCVAGLPSAAALPRFTPRPPPAC